MQWLILQQETPDDFVIATGRSETIRKFVELSAAELGWGKSNKNPPIIWENKGVKEIGRRGDTGEIVIRIDPRYFRPSEVDNLQGDPTKAFKKLGWRNKTSLEDLVKEMINFDKKEAQKEYILKREGFEIQSKHD